MVHNERVFELYRDCRLCPRQCGVDRTAGKLGVCGESADLRIAAIEAHFGEEPPISGVHGSGTVFFSGCTLRCTFCQNYQISCEHLGEVLSVSQTADRLEALSRRGVHNVNFVTPDHFLPHTLAVVSELRRRGVEVPILYNTSGYCRIESLRLLEGVADMYLPDYKYSDPELSRRLSHAPDYPDVALAALQEMVRQVGFLDAFVEDKPIASRGVLVRHLVLPGHVQNSIDALSTLFIEFGKELPISLMSQYWPARRQSLPEMNRRVTHDEFYTVYEHALSLGFTHLFVQHIRFEEAESEFLPDFRQPRPFKGNLRKENL
ncbi:MAG: radical SAM protein [candidate division KSB1 bacterium]|nr:radical SAM protein [candidate division KSB1 bacterium]MDZ7346832.1 radical SAM protein [candidate division KSB1 bacterium]